MIYYKRVAISEGINVNKLNQWKEYDIFHYLYF